MKREGRRWLMIVGIALCVLTLVYSVVLQKAGYLTYLNSDMAAETILARQQADSGHIVEMEWLYSTEIHTIHMNLLYALSFLFTDSYFAARVIGNTIGFVLGMASYVYLCRKLSLSYGVALCTAALLPLSASSLYAANMTVGGYYIVHLSFAFLGAGLWLDSAQRARRRGKGLFLALGFMMFCAIEGSLSVRYVLCFICPMLVTGALEYLFMSEQGNALRDGHERFFGMTVLGFAACVGGYVLSEIVYPHVFTSGVGAASSFQFNPLDGSAMINTVMVVFVDFLKLLGWHGGVSLFSVEGIVNLCVAAMIVLGAAAWIRVYRVLDEKDAASCAQKRMLRYAAYTFAVNMFCFIFIKGTYLNRYLIVAVLFLPVVLAIVLQRERNTRLIALLCLILCMGLGASAMVLLRDTVQQEREITANRQDMMDAAAFLLDEGYTHGYGDFWDIRVMEELTQGELTFTAIAQNPAEQGAVSPVALSLRRWGEMGRMSDLDICPEKTFLLLTSEKAQPIQTWLDMTGAPLIFENRTYLIYGFESSQAFSMCMAEGKMTLENAQHLANRKYALQRGGRLRIPPDWREAGTYTLSMRVEGEPQTDSVVRVYSGRNFEVIVDQPLVAGENSVPFSLAYDDKYLMIQIHCGSAEALNVCDLALAKER